MKKNHKAINKRKRIIEAVNNLDRNKIHVLYFQYYLNWHNFYHSPLLLGAKILSLITGKPCIDHVCHISRFDYDRSKRRYNAKIFEATASKGMF